MQEIRGSIPRGPNSASGSQFPVLSFTSGGIGGKGTYRRSQLPISCFRFSVSGFEFPVCPLDNGRLERRSSAWNFTSENLQETRLDLGHEMAISGFPDVRAKHRANIPQDGKQETRFWAKPNPDPKPTRRETKRLWPEAPVARSPKNP